MISGVGIDIVEIDRIRKVLDKDFSEKNNCFINKILSEQEIKSFQNKTWTYEFVAGRFAAKEAVSKAMNSGFRGFDVRDIEIYNDEQGMPFAVLRNKAHEAAEEKGNYKIHLSISHEKKYAVAYALMEVV